ncbi:hypothetical protein A4D02_33955 [Niastella koreensis]|uniref:Uncharacterized protein n=2 Tax=Niastella koreensis TaxID=354356 RepID=G8TC25_NIAKG|nr:hypothetical protein [Niastella koreensis]AEV99318.1 hypothetical protein Niako_2988 [Niastella koreensis GR20-10]OQP45179.1 hypothetical protein A4D02_33955 [Niastella koreensis]
MHWLRLPTPIPIAGYECKNRDKKDGVYIYLVKGKKVTPVKTLPVSVIHRKDFKWRFIKDYWTKNYKTFL